MISQEKEQVAAWDEEQVAEGANIPGNLLDKVPFSLPSILQIRMETQMFIKFIEFISNNLATSTSVTSSNVSIFLDLEQLNRLVTNLGLVLGQLRTRHRDFAGFLVNGRRRGGEMLLRAAQGTYRPEPSRISSDGGALAR